MARELAVARVVIERCSGYDKIAPALERLSKDLGLEKLVGKGDVVFIKPNAGSPTPPEREACTRPEALVALVKLLKELGAKKVIVGDHDALAAPAEFCFQRIGLYACRDVGAEVISLSKELHEEVEVPQGRVVKRILLPKIVLECDVFINFPKLKTNTFTTLSLGMKNLFGLIRREDRPRYHREEFDQALADLLKIRKPDLTIVDGVYAMEGQGPVFGTPVFVGTLIGGFDVVAVDAVASAIAGVDPWEIDAIRIAHSEGLGEGCLEEIETNAPLSEVSKPLKRPTRFLHARYPNVDVYLGGACRGCIDPIMTSLDGLDRAGLLPKAGRITVIAGKNPPTPIEYGDVVLVVGDCAQEYRDKGYFIPGCSPVLNLTDWSKKFSAKLRETS